MSRRYYRRRSQDNPVVILAVLIGLLLISAYYTLSNTQKAFALACILLVLACITLVLLQRRAYEQKKLRALEITDLDHMDGIRFEKYIAEILKSRGYSRTSLTEYYDWGVDIIAEKDNVRWGIQVKRYKGLVKAEAVRQVVAGLNKYNCSRAMVITNSTYSRQARELAKSNDCVLVDKDILADWIVAFQNGRSSHAPIL